MKTIKKDLGILLLIFALGYFLRVMFLHKLALTFGYDQARDAFTARQIVSGDLKIFGPPASTQGLFHGVFYYYFLAPAYAFTKSPIFVAYYLAFFNSLTTFIVYYLAFLMTKKRLAGLFAAFLFAISFESTQYAIWLSNPTLGVLTVPLTYLGLWLWFKENKKSGVYVSALGLGLSIQSEIFLAYHLVPILIIFYIFKKKLNIKNLSKYFLTLFATISTMALAELKFGALSALSGFSTLANSGQSVSHGDSLGDFILLFLNQLGRVYAHNSYPGNIGYGSVFVLALIVASLISWKKKEFSWQPFLTLWLISHITVASVGGTSTPFLLVGIGPAVSILIGIYLAKWWQSENKAIAISVLFILVYGNLSVILRENPHGQTIFSIQKDMTLKNQLSAVDYTYQNSQGHPFSINTITSPLWVNTVWAYLYDWYGQQKYGYLPEWHGKDQVGRLGNFLPKTAEDTAKYFLISEPLQGIPPQFVEETISSEDQVSALQSEKYFDQILIQQREKK